MAAVTKGQAVFQTQVLVPAMTSESAVTGLGLQCSRASTAAIPHNQALATAARHPAAAVNPG